MDILTLSALTHIYAIAPFIIYGRSYDPLYILYCMIILNASIVSGLWHIHGEPPGFLKYLDYAMAMIWFAMDGYISFTRCDSDTSMIILRLNNGIGILHLFIASRQSPNYKVMHSMWHLLSATKCVMVSYLIIRQ